MSFVRLSELLAKVAELTVARLVRRLESPGLACRRGGLAADPAATRGASRSSRAPSVQAPLHRDVRQVLP